MTILAIDFIPVVIIAVPILVVAALFFFFGFKGHGGQLRPAAWGFDAWSKNVELDSPPDPGTILSFDFPNVDGVHTLSKRVGKVLKVGGKIAVTFEIIGRAPKFTSQNPNLPAEMRLYIGAARLYSLGHNACTLRSGRQALTVPLTPENWKTVDGFPCNYDAAHIRQFKQDIEGSEVVGMVFGDEGGANAHGANLDGPSGGTAHFRLIAFTP